MSKIIINHEVTSGEEKSLLTNKKALKKDNEINYYDNNVKVIVKVLENKVLITREDNNMMLNLEFEQDKNLIMDYVIKDLGLTVKLETKTKEIIIKDKSIYISYDLFMNDTFSDSFTYKLEWREL